MTRTSRLAGAVMLVLVGFAPALAQDIDTRTFGSEVDYALFGEFNEGEPFMVFQALGQTFTAGGDRLDSFSFWLGHKEGSAGRGEDLQFRAVVMHWTGTEPAGVLWQSGILNAISAGPVEFAFTPGVLLDPGSVYAAFLYPWASPNTSSGHTFAHMLLHHEEDTGLGTYDGGDFLFGNLSSLTAPSGTFLGSYTWTTHETRDAAFTATFSDVPTEVVPEPVSMVLLGSGLIGVAGAARRRRRAADIVG